MSSELANRLQRYEVTPPESAWSNISRALHDEKGQSQLAERLQNYEAAPPADAWANIVARMQGAIEPSQPQTSQKRLFWFKLSAAAIVAGVIAVAGLRFFFDQSSQPEFASPLAAKGGLSSHKQPIITFKGMIEATVPAKSLAILTKAKSVFSPKKKKYEADEEHLYLRNAVVNNTPFPDTAATVMVDTRLIRNESGDIIQNLSLLNAGDNRYISVTSPNGQQTRISSKFIHALVYLKDNNYLENFQGYIDQSFLESLAWKIKFESWRKKLIETPFIPSNLNYLDIFQLKELITKEE